MISVLILHSFFFFFFWNLMNREAFPLVCSFSHDILQRFGIGHGCVFSRKTGWGVWGLPIASLRQAGRLLVGEDLIVLPWLDVQK